MLGRRAARDLKRAVYARNESCRSTGVAQKVNSLELAYKPDAEEASCVLKGPIVNEKELIEEGVNAEGTNGIVEASRMKPTDLHITTCFHALCSHVLK